jgi:hypothetical protein
MNRSRLERLAALTRGPILLSGGFALAGAGACAEPTQGSAVVSAPVADPNTAPQSAPTVAPTGAPTSAPVADTSTATVNLPRPTINAPPMLLDDDGGVPDGGRRFRPPLNAPRFLVDGGRAGGPRPPMNAPRQPTGGDPTQ